jgi:hypothetical protein
MNKQNNDVIFVESGVKYHNPNPEQNAIKLTFTIYLIYLLKVALNTITLTPIPTKTKVLLHFVQGYGYGV